LGGGSGWAGDKISLRITVDAAVVDMGTASRAAAAAAAAVDVVLRVDKIMPSLAARGITASPEEESKP